MRTATIEGLAQHVAIGFAAFLFTTASSKHEEKDIGACSSTWDAWRVRVSGLKLKPGESKNSKEEGKW
jgi:hypothetical protein